MMLHENPLKKNNVNIIGNLNAAQTIIFGHGFGTDQTTWDKVIPAFFNDYRVILYDLTGSGNSDPDAYSSNKYDSIIPHVEDLIAICKTLNLKDAIIVGHSVSGMIALLAALEAPWYFKKMILIGSSPRYINDEDYFGGFTQDALNDLYHTMKTNYYAWVGGFAPYVMQNGDKPELSAEFAKTLSSVRPDIALVVARAIFQLDYRSKLDKLDIPVLLLHAENDPAVPLSVGEYMRKQMRYSEYVVLKATGHFPQMSASEEVIKAIQAFIKE